MPQYQVTYTRKNDTTDGSAPESSLQVNVLAATEAGAISKAEKFWTEQNQFDGDREPWGDPAVVNLESDE